jgi:roadblock/LC7 domain-containing protein/ketosteroid isomerase-like protein
MATLDELLDIEGVVAAGEFNADGSLVDYKARMDMSPEMAQMTAQFCATVTMMFNTLAASYTQLSGMRWVPQQGWAYSGGDWTVAIGGGGYKGVFVETARADFNRLFEALIESEVPLRTEEIPTGAQEAPPRTEEDRGLLDTARDALAGQEEEPRREEETNVEIMRGGYEAFNRGDIDAVLGLMDPNIEWHEPEVQGLPFGGTHRGPEAVARNVFQSAAQNWDDFQVVPETFLDADDVVIVLGRFVGKGKASGRTLDAPFAHVWVLHDRKIVSLQDYTDTAQFLQTLRPRRLNVEE